VQGVGKNKGTKIMEEDYNKLIEPSDLLDRIEMLQTYVEHLGSRIDTLIKMSMRSKSNFQPPRLEDRKAKIMTLLGE
jgi:hypothetical protein